MAGFLGGLITGLICTAVGVYLTWLSGKSDREKAKELADAQVRIAQLEAEERKWQVLERFTPRIAVRATPLSGQFITVTESVPFRVAEVDYLNADGIPVCSQVVDQTGTSVQIEIDEPKVSEVQRQGCDPVDGSFSMSFRINIDVNGVTKSCLLPVKVAVNSAVKLEPMPPLGIQLSSECRTNNAGELTSTS